MPVAPQSRIPVFSMSCAAWPGLNFHPCCSSAVISDQISAISNQESSKADRAHDILSRLFKFM